jgi:hypothetical protein
MEDDVSVGWILVVPMATPSLGEHVDFDVAAVWGFVGKLDHRTEKIRPGLTIPKAGVKNPNGPTIHRDQPFPGDALLLPDQLKESFSGVGLLSFAQDGC